MGSERREELPRSPHLFYRASEFALRRCVGDAVGDEINRREDKRDHTPGAEQQVFGLEVPELGTDAGFAKIGFEPARLPQEQHSNVPFELDVRSLAHISAELAAADGARIIEWSRGGHRILPLESVTIVKQLTGS
jgi:hypothetical protein